MKEYNVRYAELLISVEQHVATKDCVLGLIGLGPNPYIIYISRRAEQTDVRMCLGPTFDQVSIFA